MELFDAEVAEVTARGVRYILRRNPTRAEQLTARRADQLPREASGEDQ